MLCLLLALCMVSALLPALSAPANAAEAYLWPLDRVYSMSRGYSSEHRGLDILADGVLGKPVRASKSGTVVYRADSCPHTNYVDDTRDCCDGTGGCNDGAGNFLVIKNDDGTYCRYLHLKQGTAIAQDTHVKQGDYIGCVGSSGRSMLPHLHFEIMSGPNASTDRVNANPTDARHSYTSSGTFKPSVSYIYETGSGVKGALETCKASAGEVKITGWAFDQKKTSDSVKVRVYIGKGYSGRVVEANLSSKDVNQTYGIKGKHGFTAVLKTTLTGRQRVAVYAVTADGKNSRSAIAIQMVDIPKGTPPANESPFTDVKKDAYYYDAVLWAVNSDPQITQGTSKTTFSPNATCTRAQVVTFLWRAAGCPKPASTKNPFTDVSKDAYYCKAVLWAVEKGVTQGTSKTMFSPNAPCTRAQVVTFLYRSEGSPKVTSKNPFKDVSKDTYYYSAVLWAVENGVTQGTDKTHFSPSKPCTRGQIVTFLYRDKN